MSKIGIDTWSARPTATNASVDGTGSLDKFARSPNLPWPGGCVVTNIIVASESGSPTETYNLFIQTQGSGAIRRFYALAVTAAVTEFQPPDMRIPPGADVYAATVTGVDANIWLMVDRQG